MRGLMRMFTFVKPYLPTYITGSILHSSQSFAFSFMGSVFLNLISAAILDSSTKGVINAAIVYAAMFAAFMAIVGVGMYFKAVSTAKATRDFKARLFRRYMKSSLESSMSGHTGEGIAALNTDATAAANGFGNAVTPFLSCVISITMSTIVVFAIDYRLGIASLAAGILSFFIQSKFAGPLGKINKNRLDANSDSVKAMSNIFSGGLAIRVFNLQEKALTGFDAENSRLRSLSFKQAFIYMWQDLFLTVQGWLTLVIVFALGGWLVATGQLSFPMLIMAPDMCMNIANGISGIGSAWAGLQAPAAAAERVFKILDSEGESKTRVYQEPEGDGSYKLNICNLKFRYLNAESDALTDLSLTVNENEMVAFVGASGSGKSTLLRTVIGMYDRENMDIRLGGMDIVKTNPINWRRKFAYVDQSCKLFDMSIAENIALGAEGDAAQELIRDSAVRASADAFISALPENYNTSCGEKGSSLSGGQKQRIAIARALCRKAPVLVFDEATSALDAESERNIMNTIENLRKDHTILITTHNLNNIINADKIVVMEGGRIAETGTHQELMEKAGIYSGLFARSMEEKAS